MGVKLNLTDLGVSLGFVEFLLKRIDFVAIGDPLLGEDQGGSNSASSGDSVHEFSCADLLDWRRFCRGFFR